MNNNNINPGWDEQNKVLTDNFGNVYDFEKQTINGVECGLERNDYEFKETEFGFYCEPKNNKPWAINVNGYTSISTDGMCSIYVNKKFQLKEIMFEDQNHDNGTKLVKNNQTKLDGKNIELQLEYDNDRCKMMDIDGKIHNRMTNYQPRANSIFYREEWLDDCLITSDHDGQSNKITARIYLMDPNNNQNYANQPVVTLEFEDGIFYCIDKIGDRVYLYHSQYYDNGNKHIGNIYVYNTRTHEIESRYQMGDVDNYISRDGLLELVEQIERHPDKNFHELLQKYHAIKLKEFFKENPKRTVLFDFYRDRGYKHDMYGIRKPKTPQKNGNEAAIVNALNDERTNKTDKKKSENLNKINNSSPQNIHNHQRSKTPNPYL